MFSSHVIGTFGSNRIYTVGRVVKVEDLMRWRFAARGFDSLRISMQDSSPLSSYVSLLLSTWTFAKVSFSSIHSANTVMDCSNFLTLACTFFLHYI